MDTPAKRYATAQDWSRLQDTILRLYLDEDKTLEEVKGHMEEHHDFFATIPMYKKKFTTWGAYKNLRFDEVLQILHLKKQRDATQKQSTYFIRNREVDHDSLQVYLSRNPSVFAKLEAGATPNPDAIRDVACRTPIPTSPTLTYRKTSPLPKCPSPLGLSHRLLPVSGEIFQALHDYLDQSFRTGLWSWSNDHCWNTHGRNGPSGLLSSVIDRCITAGLSVSRQVEPVAVRQVLDAPFAMLIRVFRNPPPILIPKLLSAAAHLERIGRGDIRGLLLHFCQDVTLSMYGQDYSLAKFWKCLASIPHPEQRDIMERVLASCISEYDKRLGPAHPLSIEVYLKYFDAVEREKDPRVQLQCLNHQLAKIKGDFSEGSLFSLLKMEHALATCKLNLKNGHLDRAEEALSQLGTNSLVTRDESFRCVWLGYIQCLKQDFAAAESLYMSSVLAAKRTGSRDCVVEALFQLETFFLHTGKSLEAERIRTERFQELRKLDSLVWADQEDVPYAQVNSSGSSITIVHIGSDESSLRWRPSAFTEVTEYGNASRAGS
ncbi:uncharacterized protein F4822DRAFT_160646 [Hypoxylon trugodes]|uniref:uncharacterized protein n=1 Tax=Hypoxylon trugodes TaxID=326681 RepID=UPI0021993B73|nr:uncharacterized protein F4822DRAFT_160646 [Hypoxylon trugodes]KAI1390681.1 hypothetical protein F4822DRAFT_160646 [Hypoxylon trugodes]